MCLQEQKLLHFRVILELRTISHKGKSMTAICVFESSFKPANECSMAEDTAFHSVTAAMAVLQSGGDVQVTWLTFYMLPIIRTRGICTVSFSLTLSMKNKYIYIWYISYCSVSSVPFIFWPTQPSIAKAAAVAAAKAAGDETGQSSSSLRPFLFCLVSLRPSTGGFFPPIP